MSARGPHRGKTTAVVLALLLLVVSAPTVQAIATGQSFDLAGPTDTLGFALPCAEAHREAVRAGEAPLWKTTQLYGQATLGDPQQRVLYPPMLLYAVFEVPLAHRLYALFHLLVLASGTFFLLRGERRSPIAAFFGATALALSWKGQAWLVAGWDTILGSAAWLPLALLFFTRATRRGKARDALLAGSTLALSALAATPIFVAFFALASPLLGLAACGWRRASLKRLVFAVAASHGFALLLLSPFLLASLETSARSLRSDVAASYGTELAPSFVEIVRALALPDLSRDDLAWERGSALGLLALPLALAGALASRRRALGVALGVAFLVLACGRGTPVGAAVALLPVVGKLSYVTRLAWISSLGVVLLASSGLDALFLAARKRRARLALGLALGAGAMIAGLASSGTLGFDEERRFSPDTIFLVKGAAIAILALAPALAWLPPRARRASAAAIAALLPVELLALSAITLVREPFASLAGSEPVERALLADDPLARLAVVTSSTFRDPVVPLYATRVERTGGCNPLATRDASHFLDAISGEPLAFRPYRELASLARLDLLALGATHVATREPLEGLEPFFFCETTLVAPCGEKRTGKVRLHRVPNALPRAWLAARALPVEGESQLDAMLAARPFDGRTTLLVDGEVPEALRGESERPLPVEIVSHHPREVLLRATAPAPGGFVVLLDALSPDWTATVDGSPVAIRRADHLFRAVLVPPGTHVVAMRLGWPASFLRGCAVTAAGIVVLILSGVRRRRGKRL